MTIRLVLEKSAELRLRLGHRWVFANEIFGIHSTSAQPDTVTSTGTKKLGQFGLQAGQVVQLCDKAGKPLASASVNPHALIAARVLDFDPEVTIDQDWLRRHLQRAAQLRRQLGYGDYGRQVFAESDGLPGLIVDRFGDVLVAQIGTAFWEQWAELPEILLSVWPAQSLVYKNDGSGRALEGLPEYTKTLSGTLPPAVEVVEGALRFSAPLAEGQKTAWFYDQRDNRDRVFGLLEPVIRASADFRALDLFCYLGGWGLRAAKAGATAVTFVDASQLALSFVKKNADANALTGITSLCDDAFEAIKTLHQSAQTFDLVVVDPPAFIKRKKDTEAGALAYKRVFEAAIRLVKPNGFLVLCSCSHHYPESELMDGLNRAMQRNRRHARVLQLLGQSLDHPIHPAMPETRYLKGVLLGLD